MAISLGPGKKRPIQKGRNFVWTQQQQRYFDRQLRKFTRQKLTVKELKVRKQARELAKKIWEETRKDLQSTLGQNEMALNKFGRERMLKMIIERMPLSKSERERVKVVMLRDSELRLAHDQFISEKGIKPQKLIKIFRETVQELKSLGPYGQRRFDPQLLEVLEQAILAEAAGKLNYIAVSNTFFNLARQINFAKLQRQYGKEIGQFVFGVTEEISRHVVDIGSRN